MDTLNNISPCHILYADDDKEDQELFLEIVSELNCPVQPRLFDNGLPLIQYLESLDNNSDFPILVILDINMPICDGIQTLSALRRIKRHASIPVIMFSTSSSPLDKKKCLELGANDFFIKPNCKRDLHKVAVKLSDYLS